VARNVAIDLGIAALEAVVLGPALLASISTARIAGILSNSMSVTMAVRSGWEKDAQNLSEVIYSVKEDVYREKTICN
jgi:hypothetical protein